MNPQTVVGDIADELARRIAAGVYPPGELVPSVRQVAAEFDVNRATAQLALGRLESCGFVEAKRGKGFTVRDVRLTGGLDVYRHLFRLSMSMPEVAIETFHDIVAVEQSLLVHTIRAYSDGEHRISSDDLHAAVDRLEEIARGPQPDIAEFLRAELAIIRDLLSAVGQTMHLASLNSVGEMVLDVPEATRAYFVASPDVHVHVWRALVTAWDGIDGPADAEAALFGDLLSMYHHNVVAAFEEQVLASGHAATTTPLADVG